MLTRFKLKKKNKKQKTKKQKGKRKRTHLLNEDLKFLGSNQNPQNHQNLNRSI